MSLGHRNQLHLARRFWHFGGVLTIALLYWQIGPRVAALIALPVSAFLIALDIVRLQSPRLNRFLSGLFKPFLRSHELRRLTGATYMAAGVSLIIVLYPKRVVLLTLLLLSVADPLASYVGIRFGKERLLGHKTLQGTLAAFLACFTITTVYCYGFGLMRERLFIVSLLAGWIGAMAELVPVGKLDDNFVFPVLTATGLTAVFYVFGG